MVVGYSCFRECLTYKEHRVFRVFSHHTPLPWWPSRGWLVPDLCPCGPLLHRLKFRIHSLREAFSAASKMFSMALLQSRPFTPRSLRVWCNDWLRIPSTQLQPVHHRFSDHCSCTLSPALCISPLSALVSLFNPVFPGNSKFQYDHLLCRLRCWHHVWVDGNGWDVFWGLELPSLVAQIIIPF